MKWYEEPVSNYRIVKVERDRVFLEDLGNAKSVTNDAERVVWAVTLQYPGRRVIYKDSLGRWDELQHSFGRFKGFAPYSEHLPEK